MSGFALISLKGLWYIREGCLILPLNEIPFIWCKSHKVSPSHANYAESYHIMHLDMCGFLSSSACYKNILSYEENLKKGTWMLMYKEKESHKNFA